MNWEAISAIGQIVGAIGVVVSLIYVATEVRNSARASEIQSAEIKVLKPHVVVRGWWCVPFGVAPPPPPLPESAAKCRNGFRTTNPSESFHPV